MFPENLKEQTFLYPTDTTFGLGCDAFNPELVEKINQIKGRSEDKNFILLVDSQKMLMDLVEVPDLAWDMIDLSEKPITIVYDSPLKVPNFLLSKEKTIAIRLTQDNLCRKIIQRLKSPIISTSANLSNDMPPQQFQHISKKITENIDYIFPESKTFVPHFASSSIIKLQTNGIVKVLRA